MTRLQIALLQHMFRSAAACRRVTAKAAARRLGVAPREITVTLDALERAGLVSGTRLTLTGLAIAVATRPARRRAYPVALAA